ncbi:MAG: hypothetical protein ACLRFI_01635 [Alphaproteobacteria bacterium]
MKIQCDFCKTEYMLDKAPASPVRCAICGHKWVVATPARKNVFLTFMASLCALLAAIVFSIVVIGHYNSKKENNMPLVASITETNIVNDEDGVGHFVIEGKLQNLTTEIYGAPDLLVYAYDEHGEIVGTPERFAAPVTLLDAGANVGFTYQMHMQTNGIKKLSVKLSEFKQ